MSATPAPPNAFRVFENHTGAQTNNELVAAPTVANRRIYVTDLIISNGATAGTFFLVEDTGGTPVQVSQTFYLPINGGAVVRFNVPIKLSELKNLGFTSATVTTHSVEVHGFYLP